MSDAIGKIGSSVSGAFTKSPMSFIGTGVSALSNFLANRKKSKYLDQQLAYQKFLQGLSTDPAKMSQYISGFQKPLSQGLLKSVGNEAQAFGAERGLSTSPQLMAEIESQALAPYEQKSQDQAIAAALSSLKMPNADPNFPDGGFDISAIIKQLLSSPGGTQGPITVDPKQQNTIQIPTPGPDVPPPTSPSGVIGEVAGADTGGINIEDLLMSLGAV